MAVRRESVVLDLDDRLTPGLLRAAGAAGVLNHELGRLDGQSTGATRSLTGLERETDNLGRKLESGGASINKYSGRLGLIIDAAVVLGPALITLGAEGVPALTAVASGFGFLAVGAGTTALAFHGVGDALTKFNKASLQPTATNIAAAQLAMDKLPASAQQFVLQLHQLGPELHQLQSAAAGGLFAGLSDGLVAVQRDLPIVKTGLRGIGEEIGSLGREAGQSLASPTWQPFLRFVSREAPSALDDMAHAAGSTAHGLAELWMAFAPINSEFDAGVVRLAHDFDQWATSLDKTKGFEDFIAYLEANGPRVLDTLGSLGNLLVDIATQAAPLGGPMLDALKAVFDVLDAIVNSNLGTPLLAGIVAFRLYARTMQLLGVQVETSWRGIAVMPSEVGGQITRLSAATTAYARTTVADLATVARAWELNFKFSALGKQMTAAETAAFGGAKSRLGAQAATALKGAAAGGALAFVASGAADSMGLSNTATLALAGSLGGPLTAALGGAAGAFLDYRHQVSDAGQAQRDLDNIIHSSTATLDDYSRVAAEAAANAAKITEQFGPGQDFNSALKHTLANPLGAINADVHGLTGNPVDTTAQQTSHAADIAQLQAQVALTQLGASLGNSDMSSPNGFAANSVKGITELEQVATRAQPAMDALGISLSQLASEPPAIQAQDIAAIQDWITHADSAQGRAQAVSLAFASMSDASLTTADRVQALTTALDQLIDPMLNLGQARDAFQKGLNDLASGLAKSSRSLKGNSDAAIQNRTAIRSQVTNLKAFVEAQAAAGVAPQKMTQTLKAGRQAIIDEGHAAGLNRAQIKAMIDQMGLTPKEIRTTIQLLGAANALGLSKQVAAALRAIPTNVSSHITVTRSTNATVADPGLHRADGGIVPGPRYPYGDKTLILAAPGEEVISNRYGQADQFRSDRAAGRIPAYASGGTVGGNQTTAKTRTDRVQHSLDKATNSLDKMTSRLDSLNQAEKQYAQQISQSLRSDLFGQTNVWGSGSTPQGILRGDIRDARAFNQALHRLRRKGVHGAAFQAIAASGDVDAARMLAGEDRSDLRTYQRLYAERSRLTNQVGAYAAGQRFDRAEAHAADQRDRLHREVVRLRHEVGHLRKEAAKHAKDGHKNAADAVNGAGRRAARRKNP